MFVQWKSNREIIIFHSLLWLLRFKDASKMLQRCFCSDVRTFPTNTCCGICGGRRIAWCNQRQSERRWMILIRISFWHKMQNFDLKLATLCITNQSISQISNDRWLYTNIYVKESWKAGKQCVNINVVLPTQQKKTAEWLLIADYDE